MAISELARQFRCGESVIARKAMDNGKIGKDVYSKIIQTTIDEYNEEKGNKKNTGGTITIQWNLGWTDVL